jgi:hypothetical protein
MRSFSCRRAARAPAHSSISLDLAAFYFQPEVDQPADSSRATFVGVAFGPGIDFINQFLRHSDGHKRIFACRRPTSFFGYNL